MVKKETMVKLAIGSDQDVMSGTPCFQGTRVPFKNLIDYLEGGHSLGEFLRQFSTVTPAMAVQALEEARNRCSPESPEDFAAQVPTSGFPR